MDLVNQAIVALADLHEGRITPEIVLNAAKSKDSPLHDHFEWDDKKASHQWRIAQARSLIRRVKIEVSIESVVVRNVCYVRDPTRPAKEQGYISVNKARQDKEIAKAVVQKEIQAARDRLRRCLNLAAQLGIEDALRQLINGIDSLDRDKFGGDPATPD